ncbi:hypothetical protein F0L68_01220 [Solihabitans fulvus]|uniref:Uncharacterized protein n=1 Tax=Solihabitans fulvus TaxID=1892852 RepID=A0A5B2XUJ1_9PSEU|nr:hypothetical protein [Solihabitans fulvus]KAA2267176.1 hypothetical protein F0L68_01220 [Solihabitans fulvus]
MSAYDGMNIDQLHDVITAEAPHAQRLTEAAAMWREAATWIDTQAGYLSNEVKKLTGNWPDNAGRMFTERVNKDLLAMYSWVDSNLISSMALPHTAIPPSGSFPTLPFLPNFGHETRMSVGIPQSKVIDQLTGLAGDIKTAQQNIERLRNYYYGLDVAVRGNTESLIKAQMIAQLDALDQKYGTAADAMRVAIGGRWTGPRAATQETSDGPVTPGKDKGGNDSSGKPGGTDPGATDPKQDPATTQPTNNDTTSTNQDTLSTQLQTAATTLDSLTQAAQTLEQLLGGGSGSSGGSSGLPSPVGLSPTDLASLQSPLGSLINPLEHLNHLAPSDNPLGLPSLAGLGGGDGIGGGAGRLGGTAGLGSAAGQPGVAPVHGSDLAPPLAAAPIAAARTTGTGTTGTSATSGTGMVPPMYPPHGAGAKSAGGVRPGAAEQANPARPRERKPNGTPGVSLLGRTARAKGAAPRSAAPTEPRRSWDPENDTVQLLDEELWQVDRKDTEPRHRTGH